MRAYGQFYGGRDADQGLQEPGVAWRRVPAQSADAGLLEPVERRRLGHPRRAGEDGLEQGAVRGGVQGFQSRGVRRRPAVRGEQEQGRVVEPGAGPDEPGADAVGTEEIHDLPLLPRRQALPSGPAAGMLHPLNSNRERRTHEYVCMYSLFVSAS